MYVRKKKNIKKDNKPIDLLLKMLYIISVSYLTTYDSPSQSRVETHETQALRQLLKLNRKEEIYVDTTERNKINIARTAKIGRAKRVREI